MGESMRDTREGALRRGVRKRRDVPRSAHGGWDAAARRCDPIDLLLEAEAGRLPWLVPVRRDAMARSAADYLRGAAASMAADVATCPLTGIHVQSSGDCHLHNFGFFASPERRLLFDITDFDETAFASWEFDVKRLAVSLVLEARRLGCGGAEQERLARIAVRAWVAGIARSESASPTDAWYDSFDEWAFVGEARRGSRLEAERLRFVERTRASTGDAMLDRLIVFRGARPVGFRPRPGSVVPLDAKDPLRTEFVEVLSRYPESLGPDRRLLLDRYGLVDVALKIVGVGSVGLRCGVALYVSPGRHPLLLQVKEAGRSVLERHAGAPPFPPAAGIDGEKARREPGRRVVQGQRMMQAASDMFLGWAPGREGRHYCVRQLCDMKQSLSGRELRAHRIGNIAALCGRVLARAHAKCTDVAELSGYLGDGVRIGAAIGRFAIDYADQVGLDFVRFQAAWRGGRMPPPAGRNG